MFKTQMTNNETCPSLPPKWEPDAMLVARSIVNGIEPPDLYWGLKPDLFFGPGDDAVIDTYLRPRVNLDFPWDVAHMVVAKTISLENRLEDSPDYRVRAAEQAFLESLHLLNRITEDSFRQGEAFYSPLVRNDRLRVRLAAAVHDELAALLDEWSGMCAQVESGAR